MKNRGKELFNKLYQDTQLTETEYKELLELHTDKEIAEYGFELARKRQKETFGNEVYTRGLIEISNYCKNDCIYCGIRRSNQNAERYRLSDEELARRRAAMETRGEGAWQPVNRERFVSAALQAYALMATSADKGAVRQLPDEA